MKNNIHTTYLSFIREKMESTILYHGTNMDFENIDPSKVRTGTTDGIGLFGDAFYLTDNLGIANFYGKLATKNDRIETYEPTGIFKSMEPVYYPDAEEYGEKNKKILTFELKGNILNVDDLILDDAFINKLKEIHSEHSPFGDEVNSIFDRVLSSMRNNKNRIHKFRGELEYVLGQTFLGDETMMAEVVSYIRSLGYDGVKFKSDQKFEGFENSWNYAIYNLKALKKI
jgi:hypothetical protein